MKKSNRKSQEPMIRKFRPDDLESIVKIERESFKTPWPGVMFERVYRMYPDGFKVATKNSEVVGYAVARVELRGEEKTRQVGHLMDLAVKKENRRRGIGSSLLETIESYLGENGVKELFLEVRTDNRGAIEFYNKQQIKKIGRVRGYYPDDTDAYIMKKDISPFKMKNT